MFFCNKTSPQPCKKHVLWKAPFSKLSWNCKKNDEIEHTCLYYICLHMLHIFVACVSKVVHIYFAYLLNVRFKFTCFTYVVFFYFHWFQCMYQIFEKTSMVHLFCNVLMKTYRLLFGCMICSPIFIDVVTYFQIFVRNYMLFCLLFTYVLYVFLIMFNVFFSFCHWFQWLYQICEKTTTFSLFLFNVVIKKCRRSFVVCDVFTIFINCVSMFTFFMNWHIVDLRFTYVCDIVYIFVLVVGHFLHIYRDVNVCTRYMRKHIFVRCCSTFSLNKYIFCFVCVVSVMLIDFWIYCHIFV